MRDVLTYQLSSSLLEVEFVDRLRLLLPEFAWRGGDSDSQGPYQSGTSTDGANLKVWFGEKPFDVLLSLSQLPKDLENRDAIKGAIVSRVCEKLADLGALVEDKA